MNVDWRKLAARRASVRLVDGTVVTLVGVRGGRVRVHFAPNPAKGGKGDGHLRTIPRTDIVEVL